MFEKSGTYLFFARQIQYVSNRSNVKASQLNTYPGMLSSSRSNHRCIWHRTHLVCRLHSSSGCTLVSSYESIISCWIDHLYIYGIRLRAPPPPPPFYQHDLTNPSMDIQSHTLLSMRWNYLTLLQTSTVQPLKCNFPQHFAGHVITYPCWD